MNQTFSDVNVKPFRLGKIPSFPLQGDELVLDHANALKNHVDILGCLFFQSRDDILSEFMEIGKTADYRAKLGTVKAAKFEKFSKMSEEDRETALDLAKEAMNHMIDQAAQHIAYGVRNYPENYCIEYKIESRVLKITGIGKNGVKLKKVATQIIASDSHTLLGSSFGRWLSMFGVKNQK